MLAEVGSETAMFDIDNNINEPNNAKLNGFTHRGEKKEEQVVDVINVVYWHRQNSRAENRATCL